MSDNTEEQSEQIAQTDASAEASGSAAPAPVADEVLLTAVDAARQALYEITPPATVGSPAGHRVEGDHVLSLLFENTLAGYPGWFWTVSLSRDPDSGEVNVLEAELMPGGEALLAPDWTPWADRLAEYQAQKKAEREAAEAAGEPEPEDDFVLGDETDTAEDELEGDELEDEDDELDDDFDALDDDDDDDDADEELHGFDEDDDEELPEDEDDDEELDESEEIQGAEEAALDDEP
ncbi:MAG TPA: DUF3027 domain-containing protein [Gryllotalpicola sp.]